MVKLILIISISFVFSLNLIRPSCSQAVLNTTIVPSPIPPTPSVLVNEKVDEIRQAVKVKISQIKGNLEKRAFVGIVKEISSTTIIITNYTGQQRLNTDETTTFIASNKKEIVLRDIAVGDKLIALGILSGENELQTIRVTVVVPDKNPPPPERQILIGQVLQIDTAKSSFAFANEGQNAATNTYKIDKNSKYSSALGEKLTSITIKSLPVNRRAILVYQIINKIPTAKSLFYLD